VTPPRSRPGARRRIAVASALLLAALARPAMSAAGALYRADVDQRNPGGKDLVMAFEEVARGARTSQVRVVYTSGASVPASMFIMHGICAIARARGSAWFIKLREWRGADGAWMMLVGFADDPAVDPQAYFGLAEKLPASGEHAFMSVARFDALFGQAP